MTLAVLPPPGPGGACVGRERAEQKSPVSRGGRRGEENGYPQAQTTVYMDTDRYTLR